MGVGRAETTAVAQSRFLNRKVGQAQCRPGERASAEPNDNTSGRLEACPTLDAFPIQGPDAGAKAKSWPNGRWTWTAFVQPE